MLFFSLVDKIPWLAVTIGICSVWQIYPGTSLNAETFSTGPKAENYKNIRVQKQQWQRQLNLKQAGRYLGAKSFVWTSLIICQDLGGCLRVRNNHHYLLSLMRRRKSWKTMKIMMKALMIRKWKLRRTKMLIVEGSEFCIFPESYC